MKTYRPMMYPCPFGPEMRSFAPRCKPDRIDIQAQVFTVYCLEKRIRHRNRTTMDTANAFHRQVGAIHHDEYAINIEKEGGRECHTSLSSTFTIGIFSIERYSNLTSCPSIIMRESSALAANQTPL